jgi:hypothetical protein
MLCAPFRRSPTCDYSCFTGYRAGQQCLSCAWWPYQKHALRDARAETPERFWIAQKGYDFLEFVFRLIDTRNISKRHLSIGLDINLGA